MAGTLDYTTGQDLHLAARKPNRINEHCDVSTLQKKLE